MFSLYQNNPRMIPDIFKPECLKMHINIESKSPITKCRNKKEKSKDSKRKNVRKKISIAGNKVTAYFIQNIPHLCSRKH